MKDLFNHLPLALRQQATLRGAMAPIVSDSVYCDLGRNRRVLLCASLSGVCCLSNCKHQYHAL